MRVAAGALAVLLCCAAAAAGAPQSLKGRRLDEALRVLQREGLAIVFSSEVVTPQMRVTVEPDVASPRRQLDEILAPHGLAAEDAAGGVLVIVRRRAAAPAANGVARSPAPRPHVPPPSPATYTDQVSVSAPADGDVRYGATDISLDRAGLQGSGGTLDTDGLAAVHAMPRVTAVDDFHSEFSVRGSPYRQIGVVIDGVATPWLEHAVYGRNDRGSLSMFGSDSLDSATLQAGAYPRLYGDALGAQLNLSLREGSRDVTRISGTAGGLTTAVDGEGPIGGSGRGSWIGGVRNSYASWPPGPHSPSSPGFSFSDLHAKLVYDFSPGQQLSVSAVGGVSTLDTIEDLRAAPLAAGTDRAAFVTARWQSTLASHTVIRQQLFGAGQDLSATSNGGGYAGGTTNRAFGYRGEVLRPAFGGVLRAGGELSRLSGTRDAGLFSPTGLGGSVSSSWTTRAAYVDFSRAAGSALSFDVGARVSDSTLVRRSASSPWVLAAWRVAPGWTINASAGVSHQFPDLDALLGATPTPPLEPERARSLDVGVEQRLANGFRWQATLFTRFEDNVLRDATVAPTLARGGIVMPTVPAAVPVGNTLTGVSRGVEVVAMPGHVGRLSGWLSYSYARTVQHDAATRETFFADFDQRHAVNAAGVFRIDARTTAGVVFRASSGVPIPGYFDRRGGALVVGDRLNAVRLPAYDRLDARVQRQLSSSKHQITIFGEVLNALNRRNQGLAPGSVQPDGAAIGFSQPLMPRRASIGIQISWSR